MKVRFPTNAQVSMFLAQLGRPMSLLHYALLVLAYRLKLQRVPVLPVTLDVEPNNICNFECPHCQVTHWEKPPKQLSLEGFREILKQFPNLIRVKLQGMGEPLLNKNLSDMLHEGEERGISMRFTTNGSVYTDETAKSLSALENTFVSVSVDGSTAEVFEKIRVKGKFDKVKANIKKLTNARGSGSKLRINLWTVVTKQNFHQLAELVRLCKALGTDGITFQLFLSNWGKGSMDQYVDPIRVERHAGDLEQALAEAMELARGEGVAAEIFESNLLSREHKCAWPWTSAYICANGDVVPCCVVADSETVKMGNVHERPFAEIWNSGAYQELRTRIRDHDLPSYCRNCYSDPPPEQTRNNVLKIIQ